MDEKNVRINEELHKQMRIASIEDGRTMKEVAEEACILWLRTREKKNKKKENLNLFDEGKK